MFMFPRYHRENLKNKIFEKFKPEDSNGHNSEPTHAYIYC